MADAVLFLGACGALFLLLCVGWFFACLITAGVRALLQRMFRS